MRFLWLDLSKSEAFIFTGDGGKLHWRKIFLEAEEMIYESQCFNNLNKT